MTTNSNETPSQQLRNQLAEAIEANDLDSAEKLLADESLLANADLRESNDRDDFSHGHPLHRACQDNKEEMAKLMLEHGSHVDAPGRNPDDRPVHGMPLHFAAAEHQNFRLANLLLDHGATANSYPHCDQATI